jgi:hypothetical protein
MGSDARVNGSDPPVVASARIVWSPSSRRFAGITKDQVFPSILANPADSPSTNISTLLKVSPSNVPLSVRSSSQSMVVPSAGSSIVVGGSGQSIVTVTDSDSSDSSVPTTPLATSVCVPSPRAGSFGSTEIVQAPVSLMSDVLPTKVSIAVSPSPTLTYRLMLSTSPSTVPLTSKVLSSPQSVTVPSGDCVISGIGTGQSISRVTSSDVAVSCPSPSP